MFLLFAITFIVSASLLLNIFSGIRNQVGFIRLLFQITGKKTTKQNSLLQRCIKLITKANIFLKIREKVTEILYSQGQQIYIVSHTIYFI